MRNRLMQIGVCAAALFCERAHAQIAPQKGDLSCVVSLDLPTHGILAARAPNPGTVHATLSIGPGGRLTKMLLATDTARPEGLEAEVSIALRGSDFAARCDGRQIELFFAFSLQDPAVDSILPPAVRSVPPNRFEITFRRVKPQ